MNSRFTLLIALISLMGIASAQDCTNAPLLHCWRAESINVVGNDMTYPLNYGACAPSFSYDGYDALYRFDASLNPKNFRIDLTGLSGDLDLLVFKECNMTGDTVLLSDCVGFSVNANSSSESVYVANGTGTYYIAIDAFDSRVRSGGTIQVVCNPDSPTPPYGGSPTPPPTPTYPPSSACSSASRLSCGSRIWANAPRSNNMNRSDYDFSDCWYSGSSYSFNGADDLYEIYVGSTKDLTIRMTDLRADMDMFLFRSCGTGSYSRKLHDCVAKSIRSGSNSETITVPNASGTYYLAVDSEYSVSSGYELSVSCSTGHTPSGCSYATDLSCGSRKWVNAPTTNHFSGNDYEMSGCWNTNYQYTGKDHIYRISAGAGNKDLTIDVTDLSADMDIFLFRSCSNGYYGGNLSNCVAKSIRSGNKNERITVPNASGTYYLVVDSYSSTVNSGYEIAVNCTTHHSYGCSDATRLSCGSRKWVNAPTRNNLSGSDYNMTGCGYSSSYSGKDHLYKVTVGSSSYGTKDLKIKLTGLSSDMDLLVFKSCSSGYGHEMLSNCVGKSVRSGSSSEIVTVPNASGTYYIAVDSKSSYSSSGYEIEVDCVSNVPDFSCNNATRLTCGSSKWVNAPTKNNMDADDYDLSGCWSTTYPYTGKDHLYRIDIGNAEKNIKIKLTGLSGDMDMFLFKSCAGSNGYSSAKKLTACVAKSINSGYRNEEIVIAGAKGTYYLAVDSYASHISSGYEIAVTCTDPEPSYSCADAVNLSCGTNNKWVDAPTTNHLSGSDYNMSSCWSSSPSYSGKDHLYKINVGASKKKLKISMTGLTKDMDMMLFKSCGTSGSGYNGHTKLSNCVAKSTKNGTASEEIVLEEAIGIYYLAIDSYNASSASGYEISVSCTSPPPPMPDPICANAMPLRCGEIFAGSTSDTYGFTSDAVDSHQGHQYTSGYTGREATHVLHGGETGLKNITILLDNKTNYTNLDLFVYKQCHDSDGYHSTPVYSDLVTCSQNTNGVDERVVVDALAPGESLYIVVDTRVGSWWQDKKANYLLYTQCEPGDYEPPVADDCIVVTAEGDNTYTVDVSSHKEMDCVNEEVAAYVIIDPETETIDDSSKVILALDSNHIATFTPSQTDEKQHFLICYTSLCDGDAEACCETVTVDARLSCGGVYTGSTVGGTSAFDKDDVAACYSSNSSFSGPDHLIRFEKADSNDVLQLVLSHTRSNLSLFIFDEDMNPAGSICKGTNYNATKAKANASTVGEVWTDEGNLLDAGVYYALVEGYSSYIASDFTLYIGCEGDPCSTDADTIHCGVTLDDETNVGAANHNHTYYTSDSTSAVAYAGGERKYALHLDHADQLTISLELEDDAGDLDLFVVSDCDGGAVYAYSIDEGDDSITADLDSGTYYIIVDGWNGATGTYSLSISDCSDPNALAEPIAEVRSNESSVAYELIVSAAPNPFASNVVLTVSSPRSDRAQVSYYSATGELLYSEARDISAGENAFYLTSGAIDGYRGMILYTVRTSESMTQGRLLRVE